MAVPYKKIARKDPQKADAIEKFYPRLVTLGQGASLKSIAHEMKERSSLSLGDIKSALTNFVEAVRISLYSGQSVNIRDFGIFSLSARTKGVNAEKDCTAKNIMVVKTDFRLSLSTRPNPTSTRAGGKIEFTDIKAALEGKEAGKNGDGDIMDDPTAQIRIT